jgi:hypothetical protein
MVQDGVRLLRAVGEDGDGVHWEMLKGVEWCKLLRIT